MLAFGAGRWSWALVWAVVRKGQGRGWGTPEKLKSKIEDIADWQGGAKILGDKAGSELVPGTWSLRCLGHSTG